MPAASPRLLRRLPPAMCLQANYFLQSVCHSRAISILPQFGLSFSPNDVFKENETAGTAFLGAHNTWQVTAPGVSQPPRLCFTAGCSSWKALQGTAVLTTPQQTAHGSPCRDSPQNPLIWVDPAPCRVPTGVPNPNFCTDTRYSSSLAGMGAAGKLLPG